MLGSVQPPSHPSAIHRCAAFASAAKSKGAPRVRVRRRVAAEASQGRVRGMRKRADREEGEEVVTAWRVVKRRMAEGDSGGKGRRGTAGGGREVGRNGIRVEGRLRECRRGLRGDEHGWGDERVADHAEVGRLAFSLAIVSSSSSRFLRFPVFSSSLFLFRSLSLSRPLSLHLAFPRASVSFCPRYHVLSLPRSLAIVLFGARGVFRGKRPGLVDGPSHGLQLSPNPSHLPGYPLSIGFPVSRLSSIFGTDLPFSPSHSLRRGFSLRAALPPRVLRHPTHPTRWKGGREEGGRTANEAETEGRRGTLPSYVLDIRAESKGIGREARERPTAFAREREERQSTLV